MRYLHGFLDSFRYDTPIRLLDKEGHVLYENTVGELTQRIMNRRIVLSAYVEGDQLIVTTALDNREGGKKARGSKRLSGKGPFCEFLSAREVFCRESPGIRAKSHAEIDAILKKSEREIKSGKRDLDKEGMSFEEYRRRRKEAWGYRAAPRGW